MAQQEFDIHAIEEKWKKYWKDNKIYEFDPKSKKIYSIDTPPPYISGKMHIGHAYSYSQQDFIVRYMRMKLKKEKGGVFYPFGTDDNGLPTERFIEKTNNVKSKDMGRTDFIKLCQKTLKEVTQECIQDFRDLAISADYDVYYSTIDDHSQKISQKSFIDLYKQGDVYREDFPTFWCWECQTSIAQAELEDKSGKTLFSTLKFGIGGSKENLLIATTRPELLGACVAVFVNPQDKRYKKLIGKKAIVPIYGNEVPILEDESAEIDKGTGVLMICSYGDKFDVDAIKRHKLNPKIVLSENGHFNELAGILKGLKIKEGRKKILEELKSKNLISEQKEIENNVNVHDKCGTEIEFLPTKQWFVKILDKKKKLIDQGKKIRWYPEFMFKRYENWINGLDWDWSISRNRHFGVPIPVWYCEKCGEIILPSEKELPVDPLQIKKKCPKCKSDKDVIGEKMVLDTWATSSLTPQIAAELKQSCGKIKIPFSLRPQGHDIIRTWAFYTIVKSFLHEKEIPWKDIVISGNVSLGGEKMSKSKGNIIKPQDVMKQYGSDATRYWAAATKLGGDLDYQEKDLVTGKKLVTKIFNASNFVFMNLEGFNGKRPKKLVMTDDLFLKELNEVVKIASQSFDTYEYSNAKMVVDNFFWKYYCDNYLEIVKWRIYNGNENEKLSAQYTLYTALFTILKLFAPIIPFITEEIYQTHFKKFEKEKSIHLCEWPTYEKINRIENSLTILFEVLGKVRHEKSKAQKSMKSEIILSLKKEMLKRLPKEILDDLKHVTNAKEIKENNEAEINVEFI